MANNSFATAREITSPINLPNTFSASNGYIHYYKVTGLDPDKSYVVDTTSSMDLYARIYNMSQSEIYRDDDSGDGSNPKVENISGLSEYYVRISSWSDRSTSGSYTLRFKEMPPTLVTSVDINQSSIVLKVGKQQTLTYTLSPYNASNKKVVWSSSSPLIATVDVSPEDGSIKVTSLSEGTTTISVTSVDGGYTDTCLVSVVPPPSFNGGSGTEVNPFLISSAKDLQDITLNLDSSMYYLQTQNISLTSYPNWNPIGTSLEPFTGNYNGQSFNITGLYCDTSSRGGLFGVATGSEFKNVVIQNGYVRAALDAGMLVATPTRCLLTNITASGTVNVNNSYAGGVLGRGSFCELVDVTYNGSVTSNRYNSSGGIGGYVADSSVIGCNVSGTILGEGNVGGIVGGGDRLLLDNCHSTAGVTSTGDNVGGMIGSGSSITLKYCSAVANIVGRNYVGGLSGNAQVNCSSSYFEGSITGVLGVGGVCGGTFSASSIVNTTSSGTVKGSSTRVGGLVGNLGDKSTLIGCSSSSTVTSPQTYVGGLVGESINSTITNCHATGDVTGNSTVGGMVGNGYDSTISSCTYLGNLLATSTDYYGQIGGIVGSSSRNVIEDSTYLGGLIKCLTQGTGGIAGESNNTRVRNCKVFGRIEGDERTGGILGSGSMDFLVDCHSSATVIATKRATGGLIGNVYKVEMRKCSSSGITQGVNDIGGLIGSANDSVIIDSHCTGNVTGSYQTGGLVGYYSGYLTNCYSTGDVVGVRSTGGLLGYGSSSYLTNCYSTSNVSSRATSNPEESRDDTGGLIGYGSGSAMVKCYYTGTVSGVTKVGGFLGTSHSSAITKSYCLAQVTGTDRVGGLMGYGYSSSYISSGYVEEGSYVTGETNVGGLIGYSQGGGYFTTVRNCYSKAEVVGNSFVGGLLGIALGTQITQCYGTGHVTGAEHTGSLIGSTNDADGVEYGGNHVRVDKCYALGEKVNRKKDSVATTFGDITGGYKPGTEDVTITNCYALDTMEFVQL